jgi:signal transduction histidine kinase
MKNLEKNSDAPIPDDEKIVFHQFIGRLINGIMPLAISRKNSIINEVSRESFVKTDCDKLAFVISNLLYDAVGSTTNSIIHISALSGERIGLVQIKTSETDLHHSFSAVISKIQASAKKMGGSISVEPLKSEGTMITFTFCIIAAA